MGKQAKSTGCPEDKMENGVHGEKKHYKHHENAATWLGQGFHRVWFVWVNAVVMPWVGDGLLLRVAGTPPPGEGGGWAQGLGI